MTVYYKATRPNGRDFRTNTIDYGAALASGEIIRHPAANRVRNDASTYLSVATVPTDCTGMRWPCRLFVVEGVGRVMRSDDLPNKRCFSALKVVEERPAHEALGPQGLEVAALVDRARRLTVRELSDLAASWTAIKDASWAAIKNASWAAIKDASRTASWDASWAAIKDASWACADAAVAILTRDIISAEVFDRLYGPWASVIGDAL